MAAIGWISNRIGEVNYHYPTEELDYKVTYTLPTGDTISTSTWTVEGITKLSESNDTTSATIWVTGGTVNTRAKATNSIVTAQGRKWKTLLYFNIRELV